MSNITNTVSQKAFGSTFFWDSEPRPQPIGQPVSGTPGPAFYNAIGNEWVTAYETRMEQDRTRMLEEQRQAVLRSTQEWQNTHVRVWWRPQEGWLPDKTQELMDKFPETTEY